MSSAWEWYRQLTGWILSVVERREPYQQGGELAEVLRLMLRRAPEMLAPEIAKALDDPDDRKVARVGEFLAKADGLRDESDSPLWDLEGEPFRAWLRRHTRLLPILLRHMPLFIQVANSGNDEESADGARQPHYQWHPHTFILLEEGVSTDDVAEALWANLFISSSSGSRVSYLQEQKRIVVELVTSDDPRLAGAARQLIDYIDREIEIERRLDLNHHAEQL